MEHLVYIVYMPICIHYNLIDNYYGLWYNWIKKKGIIMQTFLPYPNFKESAECLDNKRLNKQIVEAFQIYAANVKFNIGIKAGWQNHPAIKMWRGFEDALLLYRNTCVEEWHNRGYSSHISYVFTKEIIYPPWFGNVEFHTSHQSNLVRKLPGYYRKYFPDVPNNLPYIWPI